MVLLSLQCLLKATASAVLGAVASGHPEEQCGGLGLRTFTWMCAVRAGLGV